MFVTRSPDRPNPLGLHVAKVLAIEDLRIHVRNLEAIDGTPIVDIKPVLEARGERWKVPPHMYLGETLGIGRL